MNRIKMIVGDWSGDGHEKTEICYISSKYTADEISDSYKSILKEKKIPYPCKDYEENTISEEIVQLLKENNIQYDDILERSNTKYYLAGEEGIKDFCELYLRIASIRLPHLTWKYEQDAPGVIRAGGYGLFW